MIKKYLYVTIVCSTNYNLFSLMYYGVFLYKWYFNLTAGIKWNGRVHNAFMFSVIRDVRKRSLLSTLLFNMFLSQLLYELDGVNQGLRVGSRLYNCFAYADDVSNFASTVSGVQQLINICSEYSLMWRFKFGIKKRGLLNTSSLCKYM